MTPTTPSLALLVLLAAPAGLAQQAQAPKPIETVRPEITAARGIVAGGRNFSVAAGLRMLERGGNAVDAGVAAVFAASVV
ncbi:MAG TPA: gamma-glutamyltransferase, partial [Thermoanaerobaculia bacterium]|nr:gamma-glutamyltransferase [Thermoanaerobaculia bacterium]